MAISAALAALLGASLASAGGVASNIISNRAKNKEFDQQKKMKEMDIASGSENPDLDMISQNYGLGGTRKKQPIFNRNLPY